MTEMQKLLKKFLSKQVSSVKQKIKRRERNIMQMQKEIAYLLPSVNKEVWIEKVRERCLQIVKDKTQCFEYMQCYNCVYIRDDRSCFLNNRGRKNMQNVLEVLQLYLPDEEIKSLTLEYLL